MDGWAELPFLSSGQFEKTVATIDGYTTEGAKVLPERANWFRAFRTTPLHEVKVVILGQDPYPSSDCACGLAFSVPDGVPLPKSLQNIYQELKSDVGVVHTSGNLEHWAKQGVLLLNTSLTVLEGKPGSLSDVGWSILTTQAIKAVSDVQPSVVFILWGNHAQKMARWVDDDKHCIIASAHPSPLSAYRGFFGSKPFSRTNDYLISKNLTPIIW